MSELHTHVKVTIELFSPLHIGSGTELLLDYDLAPFRGRTFRVNENALLEKALLDAESEGADAMNEILTGLPAADLLQNSDYEQESLFRYVMPGSPFTKTAGAKIQEQIKDVYDRPYLPGSSLKGALRTILAWGLYAAHKRKPDLSRLKRGRSWAAQPLEQDLFGPSPNDDWLRALRVQDSHPLDAQECLTLQTVRVYPTQTNSSPGLNVDVETVRRGTVFETTITIDEYGFGRQAAQKLNWQGKRCWFDRLPKLARAHARQRLQAEAKYFGSRANAVGAQRFYHHLINTWSELAANEFIVQLGWGAGWESKTLGSSLLRDDDSGFENFLDKYRMTKERDRRTGDPFPKSRRLTLDGRGNPVEPLGWAKVNFVGAD